MGASKTELSICTEKYETINKLCDKKNQYNDDLRKQIEDMKNDIRKINEEKQRLQESYELHNKFSGLTCTTSNLFKSIIGKTFSSSNIEKEPEIRKRNIRKKVKI